MMTVFKTFFHMRSWLNNKEEYELKMKKLGLPDISKDENQPPQSPPASPGKRTQIKLPPPPTAEEIAEKKKAEQEAADKEMFGRYWIWNNYFSEEKRDLWQSSAQLLRHINKHVLEDMNDFILMKVFNLTKS